MGLPWVRLDANIYAHDKIIELLDDPSTQKGLAAAVYQFALAWSGGQGTDGLVRKSALKFIHGTPQVARLLVKHQLWDEHPSGWTIRNYAARQQLSDEAYTIRKSQQVGGKKGACVRHHGPTCGCWRNEGDDS